MNQLQASTLPDRVETGTHLPRVSRLLSEVGHEVIAAHASQSAFDRESRKKDESAGRADPGAVGADRSAAVESGEASRAKAQAHLTVIRARPGLVCSRTGLVNPAGTEQVVSRMVAGCNPCNLKPEKVLEEQSLDLEIDKNVAGSAAT